MEDKFGRRGNGKQFDFYTIIRGLSQKKGTEILFQGKNKNNPSTFLTEGHCVDGKAMGLTVAVKTGSKYIGNLYSSRYWSLKIFE